MKKIFAIYSTIELVEQPRWLDSFLDKYDRPYDFHVTLKQMAYIDERELPKIKNIFEKLLKTTSFSKERAHLMFNHVLLDEHDTDDSYGYIYVFADQRNKFLDTFQKKIRDKLSAYSDYYFKDSLKYELDFKPHITIAGSLDAVTFAKAVNELPKEVALKRQDYSHGFVMCQRT